MQADFGKYRAKFGSENGDLMRQIAELRAANAEKDKKI